MWILFSTIVIFCIFEPLLSFFGNLSDSLFWFLSKLRVLSFKYSMRSIFKHYFNNLKNKNRDKEREKKSAPFLLKFYKREYKKDNIWSIYESETFSWSV